MVALQGDLRDGDDRHVPAFNSKGCLNSTVPGRAPDLQQVAPGLHIGDRAFSSLKAAMAGPAPPYFRAGTARRVRLGSDVGDGDFDEMDLPVDLGLLIGMSEDYAAFHGQFGICLTQVRVDVYTPGPPCPLLPEKTHNEA